MSYHPETLRRAVMTEIVAVSLIPAAVAAGVILQDFSLEAVLPIALLIATAVAVREFSLGMRTMRSAVLLPLFVGAALIGAWGATRLLEDRVLPTAALAVLALIAIAKYGRAPFALYSAAVVSANWASPNSVPKLRPSLALTALFLAVAVAVPIVHSVTLAITALLLLMLSTIGFFAARAGRTPVEGLRVLWNEGKFVEGYFLTSGPGNVTRFRLMTVPIVLALAPSLSFFVPWEAFLGWAVDPGAWREVARAEQGTPGWLFGPFARVHSEPSRYLLSFAVAVPLLLTVPILFRFAISTPALLSLVHFRRNLPTPAQSKETLWEQAVARFAPPSGEHLFAGFRAGTREPLLLHVPIVADHGYIVGQTGSGKTSLGLTPLVMQLLRRSTEANPTAILILDLKGDNALFHTVMAEAGDRIPTRFFRPTKGFASHYFDPFDNLGAKDRTPAELSELFVQALSLFHGDFYGASYYSKQHRDLLLMALKEGPRPATWKELYDKVRALHGHQDTTELVATIHMLSQYEQLQKAPPGKDGIVMRDIIERGGVAYFCLPARLANMSVREIGKLALYAFLTAAGEYAQTGGPPRQCYVIIDEFQAIVAENIRTVLQQARSFGVSIIMANQDPMDLKLPSGIDIRSTVLTNTRFRQFFTITDAETLYYLQKFSGEQVQEVSWSTNRSMGEDGRVSDSAGTSYGKVPRLSTDAVISLTDAQNDSLFHVIRGSGATQLRGIPTRIHTPWPLTEELYRERLRKPWPGVEDVPGAAVVTKDAVDLDAEVKALKSRNQAMMDSLAAKLDGEFGGEPTPEPA